MLSSYGLVRIGSSTIVILVRWLLLAVSRMVVDSLMEQINFATDSRCYPFPGWLRDHDPPFHPTLDNQTDGQRCVRHPFQVACWVKGPGFHSNFAKTKFSLHQKPGFLRGISELSTWGVWLVTALRKSLAAVGSASLRCLGTAAPWRILVSRTGDWWVWWVVIGVCVYLQRVVIICDDRYHWLSLSWLFLPKKHGKSLVFRKVRYLFVFYYAVLHSAGMDFSSCLNHVGKR